MRKIRKRGPTGGRRVFQPDVLVCVVNRSNIRIDVNDLRPPHSLVVFEPGNVDPKNFLRNCIQPGWEYRCAESFLKQAGSALEFLTDEDGEVLLARSREVGFEAAYRELRDPDNGVVDLQRTPAVARAKVNLRNQLKSLGMLETEIPKDATVEWLSQKARDLKSRRDHLKLVPLSERKVRSGGRLQSLDVSGSQASRDAIDEMSEIQQLRLEIERLGGKWHSAMKAPKLRDLLAMVREEKGVDGGGNIDRTDMESTAVPGFVAPDGAVATG